MTPRSKRDRINNDITPGPAYGYGKGAGHFEFVHSPDILDWMFSSSAAGRARRRKYLERLKNENHDKKTMGRPAPVFTDFLLDEGRKQILEERKIHP
jgi:hypothetical protein